MYNLDASAGAWRMFFKASTRNLTRRQGPWRGDGRVHVADTTLQVGWPTRRDAGETKTSISGQTS